jgi:hypothetical protein
MAINFYWEESTGKIYFKLMSLIKNSYTKPLYLQV